MLERLGALRRRDAAMRQSRRANEIESCDSIVMLTARLTWP